MTGAEATGFLYPFIEAEKRDASDLVAALARSAQAKMRDSTALRRATVASSAATLARLAGTMAARFATGGRLFAFGNGGSATDAESAVALFRDPPWGRALPALSLVEDRAVLTALANDVGFDLVFSRQLMAHARRGDMALGISTSGDSTNVRVALAEGRRRGMLTIGLCGYGGGAMLDDPVIDVCLVVDSDSVHRIQETQDALVLHLWAALQHHLESGTAEPEETP